MTHRAVQLANDAARYLSREELAEIAQANRRDPARCAVLLGEECAAWPGPGGILPGPNEAAHAALRAARRVLAEWATLEERTRAWVSKAAAAVVELKAQGRAGWMREAQKIGAKVRAVDEAWQAGDSSELERLLLDGAS